MHTFELYANFFNQKRNLLWGGREGEVPNTKKRLQTMKKIFMGNFFDAHVEKMLIFSPLGGKKSKCRFLNAEVKDCHE